MKSIYEAPNFHIKEAEILIDFFMHDKEKQKYFQDWLNLVVSIAKERNWTSDLMGTSKYINEKKNILYSDIKKITDITVSSVNKQGYIEWILKEKDYKFTFTSLPEGWHEKIQITVSS